MVQIGNLEIYGIEGRGSRGRYTIIQKIYDQYSFVVKMHRNVGLLSEFDWENRRACSFKGAMYCNGTMQSTQTAEHLRAAQVWWWRHSGWHWISKWKTAGISPGPQVCVDQLITTEVICIKNRK